uniref:GH18 domain-containing protein n=1 Tax=Strigamia maritima TaxID=126957 RepID=T1IRN6_STRMM
MFYVNCSNSGCKSWYVTSHRRVCYFVNNQLPVGKLDTSLCTHIIFAFAEISENGTLIPANPNDPEVYSQLIQLKQKAPSLKLMVSTGSDRLSAISKTTESRRIVIRFCKECNRVFKKYDFDGIDIDWEFPGIFGRGNFVALLKEINEISLIMFGEGDNKPLLTAAVSAVPAKIIESYNIPQIAKYVDFVNIMCYSYNYFHKSFPFTGYNSPLFKRKYDLPYANMMNIEWGTNHWAYEGMPKNKIVVGIPTYGHTYILANPKWHKVYDLAIGSGIFEGDINFPQVCDLLHNGGERAFDNQTMVPYYFQDKNWISYEDEVSMTYKAKWIVSQNFSGVMTWTLNSDDWSGHCGMGPFPLHTILRDIVLYLLTLVEETVEFLRHLRRPRIHPIPVRPVSPNDSPHIEMVQVGAKRTLRIIHLKSKKNEEKRQTDEEKLQFQDKLDIWAEILIQQAIKDALTQFRQSFVHQNGIGGIVNPCYVDDLSSESSWCSTWGSNMADAVHFQKLHSFYSDEKPLIFFIHGVGSSADVWTNQIGYFQEHGYETVAVDLIGHGFSSAPYGSKFYKFKQILADILVIFDKYSLQRNVVVGHSYGSSLASALAQKRSSKVCNLILMSGGGPVGLKRRETGFTCMTCLKICVQPLDYCGLYSRELFYCPSSREIAIPRTYEVPTYVLENYAYGQTWREGNLSFYRSIKIPTLLIYGLRDPYVTLVEECEMEKAIPRSVLELIPNASHMIMLDEAIRVNKLMYRFVH